MNSSSLHHPDPDQLGEEIASLLEQIRRARALGVLQDIGSIEGIPLRRLADLLLAWQDLDGAILLLASEEPADEVYETADLGDEPRESVEAETKPMSQVEPQPQASERTEVTEAAPALVETNPETSDLAPANAERESAPTPPPPASKPASRAALRSLAETIEQGGLVQSHESHEGPWYAAFDAILLGLQLGGSASEELERLVEAVPACEHEWVRFPKPVQRLLLEHVVARLRVLQDEHCIDDWRLNRSFQVLTQYSADAQPGFVFGLSRSHNPVRNSWSADAMFTWDELNDLLPSAPSPSPNRERLLSAIEPVEAELHEVSGPILDAVESQFRRLIATALDGGVRAKDPGLVRLAADHMRLLNDPQFRALRRAIRAEQSEDEDTDEVELDGPPDDWGWWSHARGKRAVLLGGSPREKNRQRLEEVFRFAELQWWPADHGRNNLQKLRDRVKSGGVELVIVLRRFIGHDTDDVVVQACKDSGVPWVQVAHGYGANQIQAAVERFLEPELAPVAARA